VEGVTLIVKVAGVPCAIGNVVVLAKVVAEAVRLAAEAQAPIKLATFTEPNPVARSYPVVALKAGVVPPATSRIPNAPEVELLQFVLPPWHATELLLLFTS
jgi:hypothetical protein